jgi:hypothetical protein
MVLEALLLEDLGETQDLLEGQLRLVKTEEMAIQAS